MKKAFISREVKRAKKEVSGFFEIDTSKIEVEIIPNRKEFDKVRGMKTEAWQIGTGKNGKVQVLNPSLWAEEGVHDPSTFFDLVKHELIHVVYISLTKGSHKPFWLNEGLAYYVAGQSYAINRDDKGLTPDDLFDEKSFLSQRVGYPIVKDLIEKFGKEKLLGLVETIKPGLSKAEFNQLFSDIFGKNPNEYYSGIRKGPTAR